MTTVLIIHTTLWSHYKARLYSEIQQQIDQQHLPVRIHVVHLARTEQSRLKLSDPDLSLHNYPYQVLHAGTLEEVGLKQRFTALLAIIRQIKPDVVNVPGYFDPIVMALSLYCRMRGIRIIMSIDSTVNDQVRVGWKEALKRQIVKLGNGFFCYGTRSTAYLRQLGVPREKVLSERNTVDNDRIRQEHDRAYQHRPEMQQANNLPGHNFIYVGRLIDRLKNISGLINAFAAAYKQADSPPDWGLLILGDGVDEPALRTLAAKHTGIPITFVPGQAWYEVPAWLALADVLVLPSFSEPWGLVVNEAMACQMPVIVSDRCGCADDLVVPGVNGFIFDPTDESALSSYLSRFMSNEVDRQQMGRASGERIAPYSPEAVAREMLDGFQRVVSDEASTDVLATTHHH